MSKETILITGGSGYLGQFLVAEFAKTCKVGFTHHTSIAPTFKGDVTPFWVDLTAPGDGLQQIFDALGRVDVVINTAALSSPAACQRNLDAARALNVPSNLLECLTAQRDAPGGYQALLVHMSTDQVYDGSHPLWGEQDACAPVNAYGLTKREAEVAIQDQWPHHVILRSSIIYGPQCHSPVSRPLFLQFVENSLRSGKSTTFFEDEFRNPIHVNVRSDPDSGISLDIVAVMRAAIRLQGSLKHRVFNMGGPERLSRVDMANKVAEAHGYEKRGIVAVPSSSVDRGFTSPLDISMVMTRLQAELGVALTPFSTAVKAMGPTCGDGLL